MNNFITIFFKQLQEQRTASRHEFEKYSFAINRLKRIKSFEAEHFHYLTRHYFELQELENLLEGYPSNKVKLLLLRAPENANIGDTVEDFMTETLYEERNEKKAKALSIYLEVGREYFKSLSINDCKDIIEQTKKYWSSPIEKKALNDFVQSLDNSSKLIV